MTLSAPLSRRVLTPAVLLAACLPLGCKRAAPAEEEKAPPATVKWQGPNGNNLEEWTELVGTTQALPDRVALVSAAVPGQVVSVLQGADGKPVTEGQHVDKGTVLVRLDDTLIKANLAKLEASLEVIPEELKQAQNAVELATIDVERLRRLTEGDDRRPGITGGRQLPLSVSEVERQKADIALKDAQSKLKAVRLRQIAGTREVEALKEQLRLYTLTAPIGGRVGRVEVRPGQTLAAGAPVTEIMDIDEQIDVLCFVPPRIVQSLQVGQQAQSGPADKDPKAPLEVEADGQIDFIAEQAETETGNFAVKVRFPNKEVKLRANRVLRIRVLTKPGRECLSLPEAAVLTDEDPPTVVVVENVKTAKNAEGKDETTGVARRLQVTLGVRDRQLHQVEIVGLKDKEAEKDPAKKWKGEIKDALFIVEGAHGLQTGDSVKLEADED
jgi:RND family efflux transporter MFP subunit